MAKAFMCDRCGKLFIEETNSGFIVSKRSLYGPKTLDFCPECAEALKDWFNLDKSKESEEG